MAILTFQGMPGTPLCQKIYNAYCVFVLADTATAFCLYRENSQLVIERILKREHNLLYSKPF